MTAHPAIHHHPSDATLAAYAAGSATEGTALLVACHLTYCPACRNAVATFESAGGSLLETMPPDPLTVGALDSVLTRLGDSTPEAPTAAPAQATPPPPPPFSAPAETERAALLLPSPLKAALPMTGTADSGLPWRTLAPGIKQIPVLPRTGAGGNARLFKVAPHKSLPKHGHSGREYTLVLRGSFSDAVGCFTVGDVAEVEESTVHNPVVEETECICLIVTEGPLRYRGMIGRLLQPLTGL